MEVHFPKHELLRIDSSSSGEYPLKDTDNVASQL